jgi:hypothetical protein
MRRTPPSTSSTETRTGARVEAVFEQFLERGGGPVDHFAGGDLVDQKLGKLRIRGTWNVTLAVLFSAPAPRRRSGMNPAAPRPPGFGRHRHAAARRAAAAAIPLFPGRVPRRPSWWSSPSARSCGKTSHARGSSPGSSRSRS